MSFRKKIRNERTGRDEYYYVEEKLEKTEEPIVEVEVVKPRFTGKKKNYLTGEE